MSDLNDYLKNRKAEGRRDSDGVFTLSGERARQELARSVPENLTKPWAICSLFRCALILSGLTETRRPPVAGLSAVLGFRWTREQGCLLEGQRLRDLVAKTAEQPFHQNSAVVTCLSRGLLALIRGNLGIFLTFPGTSIPDFKLGNCPEVAFAQRSPTVGHPAEVILVFPMEFFPHFLSYYNPLRIAEALRQRAEATETRVFGVEFPATSVWTRAPSRVAADEALHYSEGGGWFDYRTSRAVLLEYIVPSESDQSPLVVSRDCQTAARLGEHMTGWERFRTKGENLILRHWSRPVDTPCSLVPVRAILAVVLSDAPSRVVFCNWGRTQENTTVEGVPPGLGGVVWWPELEQTIYGENWVTNEAYEAALDWFRGEAAKAFAILSEQFDYVWDMIQRDHLRKGYRTDVHRRLQTWLGGPGRGPSSDE